MGSCTVSAPVEWRPGVDVTARFGVTATARRVSQRVEIVKRGRAGESVAAWLTSPGEARALADALHDAADVWERAVRDAEA